MTRQLKPNQTQPEERLVPMRLQKFLARAGAASRRGSENLMTAGRVTVNGRVVTELGSKVDPLVDQVAVDGVPVRLEVGPRDIENGQCVLVRRDTREKQFVKFEELATAIPAAMEALAKDLYDRALQNRENRTYSATTMDEVKQLAKEHTGFIKTMWCGDLACEEAMKADAGLSSRCMPFAQEHLSDVCPVCGKPAQKMVVWGVAY